MCKETCKVFLFEMSVGSARPGSSGPGLGVGDSSPTSSSEPQLEQKEGTGLILGQPAWLTTSATPQAINLALPPCGCWEINSLP